MSLTAIVHPRRLTRLLGADTRSISRDPIMIAAMVLALLPAAVLAIWDGPLIALGQSAFGLDDLAFYTIPLALMMPVALVGWVVGFLLLEDRDDGTLMAMTVTPVGKSGYIAYRIGFAFLLAFLCTLYGCVLLPVGGGPVMALALAVLVGLNAVLFSLALAALAGNKVEGLALTKLLNIASMLPYLALIPGPLRFLAGVLPPFWIGELLGITARHPLPLGLAFPIALVVHLVAIAALVRVIDRRMG